MKYIRNFLVKYSHIWVFLYGLIYFPWFTYLEKNVTNNFHIIHMAIDDSIPFVEYFVVPYFLWFGYVAAAVAYFFFKNKHDFYRLCGFLAAGMTIFLVVSTIYPNGHTDRKVLHTITFLRRQLHGFMLPTHRRISFRAFMFTTLSVYILP